MKQYRYAEFTAGKGGAMLLDEEKDPHEVKNVVDDPAYAAAKAELSPLVAAYWRSMAAGESTSAGGSIKRFRNKKGSHPMDGFLTVKHHRVKDDFLSTLRASSHSLMAVPVAFRAATRWPSKS